MRSMAILLECSVHPSRLWLLNHPSLPSLPLPIPSVACRGKPKWPPQGPPGVNTSAQAELAQGSKLPGFVNVEGGPAGSEVAKAPTTCLSTSHLTLPKVIPNTHLNMLAERQSPLSPTRADIQHGSERAREDGFGSISPSSQALTHRYCGTRARWVGPG